MPVAKSSLLDVCINTSEAAPSATSPEALDFGREPNEEVTTHIAMVGPLQLFWIYKLAQRFRSSHTSAEVPFACVETACCSMPLGVHMNLLSIHAMTPSVPRTNTRRCQPP
jgi:hypothetical protein